MHAIIMKENNVKNNHGYIHIMLRDMTENVVKFVAGERSDWTSMLYGLNISGKQLVIVDGHKYPNYLVFYKQFKRTWICCGCLSIRAKNCSSLTWSRLNLSQFETQKLLIRLESTSFENCHQKLRRIQYKSLIFP